MKLNAVKPMMNLKMISFSHDWAVGGLKFVRYVKVEGMSQTFDQLVRRHHHDDDSASHRDIAAKRYLPQLERDG